MKTMLFLISIGLLSGCAIFQARTYDPVEYNYAVMITTNATHATHRCISMADPDYDKYLQLLNHDSLTLVEYVSDKADAAQVVPASQQIRDMTSTMLGHKIYSVAYCQHKLSNIQASARTFARAVSGNRDYDMCQSDVQNRFDFFKKSYDSTLISKEEYEELIGDLLKLQTVDTSGCTLEERSKMQKALNVVKDAATLGGML